jgi:hypothetical protein
MAICGGGEGELYEELGSGHNSPISYGTTVVMWKVRLTRKIFSKYLLTYLLTELSPP